MASEGALNFVELLVGTEAEPFASAVLAGSIITLVGLKSVKEISKREDPLIPDETLSIRNIGELVADFVLRLGDNVMGRENRRYLPVVGVLFFYIFALNLLGLVPGFSGPTDGITFNLGIALVVFALYNYWGAREVGVINYLKHFCGPVWALAPALFLVELISHAVRPVSLSVRLYGNMTGDHTLLATFTDLTKVVIPVVFYGLGSFVSFMQAVIFSLLTMVYIRLAVAHDDDHH